MIVPSTDDTDNDLSGLFTKIDHVGIAVPDLDDAIAFYRDTFGVVSVHEEVNEEQGVREAMLAVGDGSTRIQLLAPLTPQSTIAKFLDRNGPGVQQVAYTVDDIEAVSRDPARARPAPALRPSPGAARPTAGSTSSTRRTPAACSSNSSSMPDERSSQPNRRYSPVTYAVSTRRPLARGGHRGRSRGRHPHRDPDR